MVVTTYLHPVAFVYDNTILCFVTMFDLKKCGVIIIPCTMCSIYMVECKGGLFLGSWNEAVNGGVRVL